VVPSQEPDVRLAWPDTGADEAAAVAEVLESGLLTMGEKVAELEAGLAAACEVEHAVAVSSGTAALHLAVLALGIGPGDEVVVPAYTFPATANVVALAGATPVLVDVDPATNNIDPAKVEVTPRTRAIMPVHLFGRPARLEELPDLPLIEDAAGALGARHRGRACGGLGAAGCLSFHPRKIVTTGEGGAVTTNDADLAERIRSLRHHGWSPSNVYDDMPAAGFNYRIPDILCAVGIPQLARLEELLARREEIAAGYEERLRDLPIVLPGVDMGDRHGWQAYVIQVDRRDEVMAALRAQGIQCQIGTYALHRLGAYRDQGSFRGADRCFERCLALPLHTRLTDAELDRVAERLAAAL
jgi:dTDP-4-amino-4,6-dideoxygalactose transaminase